MAAPSNHSVIPVFLPEEWAFSGLHVLAVSASWGEELALRLVWPPDARSAPWTRWPRRSQGIDPEGPEGLGRTDNMAMTWL